MSTPRIVQRSPDLGLGIRLQRLQEAKPAPQAQPKPPFWWGWADSKDQQLTTLEVLWNEFSSPAYFPGLWVAVVEDAVAVTWHLEYTPTVWFVGDGPGDVEAIAWQGDPQTVQLPPSGKLPAPEVLFAPNYASLPDPLRVGTTDIPLNGYWAGSVSTAPMFVAIGNTLSVTADSHSPSGILVAQAFVKGANVGTVKLTLKRVNRRIWT